ncbi:cell division protein FtsZ [Elusimicrobiota bacterium]
MIISIEEEHVKGNACLTVIGAGGGGGNAVNRMVEAGIKGVDFIAANTDAQALKDSRAGIRIQLGENYTRGLGAGGDPAVGEKAAEEDRDTIRDSLKNSDMVFITAGLGGGTGTGSAPVIAKISKELGALTVGVVTKPFMFEGKKRHQRAMEGLNKLSNNVDTLLVIPNQRLFSVISEGTAATDAFTVADDVLRQAVQSISDVITSTGLINVDFADVKAVMQNAGEAIMGLGYGEGDNKAVKAAKSAITSPLLEDVSIEGASGLLVNVTGAKNMTLYEINEAMELIHQSVSSESDVYFGHTIDEDLVNAMKITVIATGCRKKQDEVRPKIDSPVQSVDIPDSSEEKKKKMPAFLRKKRNKN